jgi:four helix bundle protein
MRNDKENVIVTKSLQFAVEIVKFSEKLEGEKKFVIARQILKSGTSIGANVEESIGGQSDRDFLSKLSISYKEARETIYWIKLLHATDFLNDKEAESLLNDAEELCRILGKIQITLKNKLRIKNYVSVIRN